MYDFVKLKGVGGKISSSKGGGLRVKDVLDVYTPEMVLYIFAGTRPNSEIDISFDLDVIKIYEDFDKLERIYYGLETEKNPKKLATLKRIYELSIVNGTQIQKKLPFQPSFRHLTTISQANNFDFEKVKEYYIKEINNDFDITRLKQRFDCAKKWLEQYAPEDMRFQINEKIDKNIIINKNIQEIISKLLLEIDKTNDSAELMSKFKQFSIEYEISPKEIFTHLYKLIIGKEKGPRLANLILENKEKVKKILKQTQ
jgi:lysyl-tRNA synthetase class 1